MALGGFYANQLFRQHELPIKVAAVSRCYRAETSAINEEKGTYRYVCVCVCVDATNLYYRIDFYLEMCCKFLEFINLPKLKCSAYVINSNLKR